jgi:hypothetical protein
MRQWQFLNSSVHILTYDRKKEKRKEEKNSSSSFRHLALFFFLLLLLPLLQLQLLSPHFGPRSKVNADENLGRFPELNEVDDVLGEANRETEQGHCVRVGHVS